MVGMGDGHGQAAAQPSLAKQFEFVDMPGDGCPALGAWLLAIPVNISDRQKYLARELIQFATDKAQLKTAACAGNPPSLASLLNDPKLVEPFTFPSFPQQLASLRKARPRPRTPYWRDIEASMGACLSALYESTITVTEASNRINKAIELTLAGRKPNGFSCKEDVP